MKLWKRLTALCLSALVCVTLLTACGRKESTDGRASLSVCVGETPATYDPIYAQQIGDQTILNHLYENLMRLEKGENGQTTAVPGAAKSVDMKENSDGTVTYTPLAGDVRMEHVDFGYVPEKTVLHDVTLYAHPGQKIAFVGATGAGKTTITNLINRFYDIADGKIRYDGINVNKIAKPDLRHSLGIVLQETNLFTGTVMENIRYGKLDATDEECIAAAKLAMAIERHKTAGDLTPAELNSLQQALRDTRDAAHLLSGYYDTPRQDIGLTMQGIHARRTRDDH